MKQIEKITHLKIYNKKNQYKTLKNTKITTNKNINPNQIKKTYIKKI